MSANLSVWEFPFLLPNIWFPVTLRIILVTSTNIHHLCPQISVYGNFNFCLILLFFLIKRVYLTRYYIIGISVDVLLSVFILGKHTIYPAQRNPVTKFRVPCHFAQYFGNKYKHTAPMSANLYVRHGQTKHWSYTGFKLIQCSK